VATTYSGGNEENALADGVICLHFQAN